MFIKTTFTNNCKNEYCDVLAAIDSKLTYYGITQLNNIRYGFQNHIDYDKYEDLSIYKMIMINIINSSDCLCNINVPLIISKIRKITNSIC